MWSWWWYRTDDDDTKIGPAILQLDVQSGVIVDASNASDCTLPFDPDDWGNEWAPCGLPTEAAHQIASALTTDEVRTEALAVVREMLPDAVGSRVANAISTRIAKKLAEHRQKFLR